jgi:hypothetical protein
MAKTVEEIKLWVALTLQRKHRKNKKTYKEPDEELDEKKLNQDAIKIMNEEGTDKAVEFMFNPTGKRQLTYAEMRMYFG